MARKPRDDNYDDRELTEKLANADFGSIDSAQAASATRTVAGLAGGFVGKIVPGLDILDVGLASVEGETQARKEARKISHDIGNLDKLARSNRTFRRKKRELDERWQGSMLEAAVSAGGGMAGGALVGSLVGGMAGTIALPIIGSIGGATIGFIAGSFAGGITANRLYNSLCVKQAQDPITINQQICKMRGAGEQIPKELVFAALAANLSGKEGKLADKTLKKYTGTKLFTEALQDPKGMDRLSAMMNDQSLRTAIRANTKLPRDPNDPGKSVVAQYAELINSGALDPRDLLKSGAGQLAMTRLAGQTDYSQNPEVPMTPGIDRTQARTV